MSGKSQHQIRRVLIASANPLFSKGLSKLFRERWKDHAEVVGVTTHMDGALEMMEKHKPDLVILDYDDRNLNREEFLAHFVSGSQPLQLMLVSLKESGAVVVYDRRTLSFAQLEDWLDHINESGDQATGLSNTSDAGGKDLHQYELPGAYFSTAVQRTVIKEWEIGALMLGAAAVQLAWAVLSNANLTQLPVILGWAVVFIILWIARRA